MPSPSKILKIRTVTHKLYGKRKSRVEDKDQSKSEDEDQPPIIWSVDVYDPRSLNSAYRRKLLPDATYKSDKPLETTLGTKTKQAATTPAIDSLIDTPPRPTRAGCVFEVSCATVANLSVRPSNKRTVESMGKPVAIEDLDFQSVFPRYIDIKSPFLCRVLKTLVGYYPEFFYYTRAAEWEDVTAVQSLSQKSLLRIWEPWGSLLHRFPEMKAFAGTPETQGSQDGNEVNRQDRDIKHLEKEHLHRLVEFLEPYYNSRVIPCIEILEQRNPQLPFNMLWYVFAPGTDVYWKHDKMVSACVVIDMESNLARVPEGNKKKEVERWFLHLWYLDSDGQHIGRKTVGHVIPAYTGAKALTSLAVCPSTVWDSHDGGERRAKILESSKLVFESIQKGHLLANYNGPIPGSNKHYSGNIIIDHKRGMSYMGEKPPKFYQIDDFSTRFAKYDIMRVNVADPDSDDIDLMESDSDLDRSNQRSDNSVERMRDNDETDSEELPDVPSPTTSLSDHQLLLLHPRIRAFAIKTKQWLHIAPDGLLKLAQSSEGVDNLIIGQDEIKAIKGLSRRHNSKRDPWAADFIEGKGTGQIILLHGPPGVGKTYTVEAIAQYLCRPLLALTVADIGTIETKVERELIRWFTLAEAWNAVLLVDEADIFLERRQNRDLSRNGLVSAFLRRMEYFKGLLFLTTNRVGQIDDAFISRVHVAIGYSALSPEYRSKIWQGFFRKLAKERAGKIQIAPAAKKWVLDKAISGEAQLNGRDIRNALQTAITLAEAECEEDPDFDADKMTIIVDQSHFQRVLDITNKFQSYVQSIRREDEKKRAAGRYDRNDYWRVENRGMD